MVESIKELKKICFKCKQPWFTREVTRTVSLYITKLFLYTPITPNQVTLMVVFFGLLSAFFFSFGGYSYSIAGAFLFMFKYILDGVDGNIARYRKTGSALGFYYDRLEHRLVEPLIFIGIGYGTFLIFNNVNFILMGTLIALCLLWIPCIIAEKIRAFVEKEEKIIKKGTEKKENKKTAEKSEAIGIINFGKKIFDKIGFLSRPPAMINILIILALFNYTYLSLYFYSIFLPIVTVGIFFYENQK